MVFLYKIAFLISVSSLAVLIIFRLIKKMTLKKSEPVEITPPVSLYLSLSANPYSKHSRLIKLAFSSIVLVIFTVILGKFLFALIFAVAAYIFTGMYFQSKINRNMEMFENQLIDVVGIIANSVRAGQALLQALENVEKDTEPPISNYFSQALNRIRLGTPMGRALDEMAESVKSKNLKIAVNSINISRETGGNLGEILSQLTATMRERKRIQGKITALTAQGKASGIIIGCVPFFLLVVLYMMEPDMIGLMFSTLIGNVLIVIAIAMVSIGMFFINRIVDIDI